MYMSSWIAIALQAAGALLSIPYFLEVHKDEFSVSDWAHWVRVITYGLTLISAGFLVAPFMKKTKGFVYAGVSFEVLVGLLLSFNLIFGSRTPSQALCDDWDDVCLEQSGDFTNDESVDNWQGLLFIGGTCFSLTAVPWLVMELLEIFSEKHKLSESIESLRNKELQENFAHDNHFEQAPSDPQKDHFKQDTRTVSPPDPLTNFAQDDQRVFEPVGREAKIVKDDNPKGERPIIVPNRRGAGIRKPTRGSVNIPLH
mmetsp:Transcript_25824/g.45548  ORF Transcript_25824/g.45548 Transcript_25824/m.45548 type:complete len:256 (+) Transcript_25824:6952-7719(+)